MAWRLEGLGWEVLTGYGLTETSPILTFNPPGRARIESVGLAVEGVELRLGPAEDAQAGHGEILARGPNVFSGYWDNPQATAEAFTEDGFFRTGDLGRLDELGYLYIVGRSKELIILSGGENIFPEDVERSTARRPRRARSRCWSTTTGWSRCSCPIRKRSAPGRRQSCSGISAARSSGSPRSCRHTPASAISRSRVSRCRAPRSASCAGTSCPRSSSRRRRARAGRSRRRRSPAPIGRCSETPPADRIWPWLKERFAGHALTLNTSPQLDLGLDSFDWMSLTMELEERFSVRLSEDALARVMHCVTCCRRRAKASETAPHAELGQPTPEEERLLAPRGPIQENPRARPAHPRPLALSGRCFGCGSTASSICRKGGHI